MVVSPLIEGDFCDEDEAELAACDYNKDYINQVNSNYNIKVINHWNVFSNTNYFKRNFQVLKLSNLPFARKFHCNTCPNIASNCGLTYTLSSNGYITTSFESGLSPRSILLRMATSISSNAATLRSGNSFSSLSLRSLSPIVSVDISPIDKFCQIYVVSHC